MQLKLEKTKSVDRHKQAYENVVNNPEFKKWFEGSKVLDENGNPQVMYHGTYKKFQKFDPEAGNFGSHLGSLTAAESIIRKYKDRMLSTAYFDEDSRIVPVFVKIKKPFITEDIFDFNDRTFWLSSIRKSSQLTEEQKKLFTLDTSPKVIKSILASLGFDGIRYENKYESPGEDSFIVFDENQTWSLYANQPM